MNLNTLPPELLYIIFQNLDDIDILHLSYTTTYLHDTAANEAYRRIKNLIGVEPAYHGNNCLWYIQLLEKGCDYPFIDERINFVNRYTAAYLAMKIDLPKYHEATYIYKIDNVNYHTFIRYHHIEAFISNNCITVVLYMLSRPWFFYTEADYQSIYQSLFNKDNMDTAIEYMILNVPCILNKDHGYSNVCLLIEHGYLSIVTHVNLELFDDDEHKRWIHTSINFNQIHITDYLMSHTPGSNRTYYRLLEAPIKNNNIDTVKAICEDIVSYKYLPLSVTIAIKYGKGDYYFKLMMRYGFKYSQKSIPVLIEECIRHNQMNILKHLCNDYVLTNDMFEFLITKTILYGRYYLMIYLLLNNPHIELNNIKLYLISSYVIYSSYNSVKICCYLINNGIRFKSCQVELLRFCVGGPPCAIQLFRALADNDADLSLITDNQMIVIAKHIKYGHYREMYDIIMRYRNSMLSDYIMIRLYSRIRNYFVFGKYV